MATTGAANTFVLNITELQNTVTTATGLTPFDTLSAQIGQIQEMVIYDEKRIAVNTISAYNTTPISVVDPMDISSAGNLTIAGQTVVAGGTGAAAGPTGPTGPAESYTPVTTSNWVGTGPATVQAALERMANLLVYLNGGNAIP